MAIDASNIMSDGLTVFSPQDRSKSVYREMDEESFDVAPILAENVVRRLVLKEDLEEVDPTQPVMDEAREIQEKHIVGNDVPVISTTPGKRDLLGIMKERNMDFVFVINDGIEGIVTHADFNRPQAGIPLYQLISEYEAAISNIIDKNIQHDRWMSAFDESTQEDIKSLYKEEVGENAELRLVDCLNTRYLHSVLLEHGLWTELGFDEEEEAEETLKEIKDLRDDVMHQRPLIGDNSFSEFARDVKHLQEINLYLNSQDQE